MMAAVTMSVIPMIIVFVLMQKQFIRGISSGAAKGWAVSSNLRKLRILMPFSPKTRFLSSTNLDLPRLESRVFG